MEESGQEVTVSPFFLRLMTICEIIVCDIFIQFSLKMQGYLTITL